MGRNGPKTRIHEGDFGVASDQIPGQNNIGDGSYDLMLPHETQHVEARSPYQT